MNLKPTLILVTCLAACSFQGQASLCNGGFEDGLFTQPTCWEPFEEQFGFLEVISSYTDGSGNTFTPTEGSFFLNIWGGNDLGQSFSWSAGDQLSLDWITVPGRLLPASDIHLEIALFDTIFPINNPFIIIDRIPGDATAITFNSTTLIFTQDSPRHGMLLFTARPPDGGFAPRPFSDLTNADVAHILIDNVQLTRNSEIPEPEGVYLIAIGIFLGWISHKTRRRKSI